MNLGFTMNTFSLQNILSRPSFENERLLAAQDAQKIMQLFEMLDAFVLKTTDILQHLKSDNITKIEEASKRVRDVWIKEGKALDQFIESDEFKALTEEDKQIIMNWQQVRINGKFICSKYFSEYAVMTSLDNQELQGIFFGVKAISHDFEKIFHVNPPFIIETTLLPYKDCIVWDGIGQVADLSCNRIQTKYFCEQSKKARKNGYIITKLM